MSALADQIAEVHAYSPNHGTVGRYRKGCRCDSCRDAKKRDKAAYTARRKARAAAGIQPRAAGRPMIPLSERPHGDYVTYAKGCRCQPCRAANAEYGRRRQERIRGSEDPRVASLRRLAASLGYRICKTAEETKP
jgi:hypothetical protein